MDFTGRHPGKSLDYSEESSEKQCYVRITQTLDLHFTLSLKSIWTSKAKCELRIHFVIGMVQ